MRDEAVDGCSISRSKMAEVDECIEDAEEGRERWWWCGIGWGCAMPWLGEAYLGVGAWRGRGIAEPIGMPSCDGARSMPEPKMLEPPAAPLVDR